MKQLIDPGHGELAFTGIAGIGQRPTTRSGTLARLGKAATTQSSIMFAALATRAFGQAVVTLGLAHRLSLSSFARYAVIAAVVRLLAPIANLGTSTAILADWAQPERASARWLLRRHILRVAWGSILAVGLGTLGVAAFTGGIDWVVLALLASLVIPVSARSLLMPLAVSLKREGLFFASEAVRAASGIVALGWLVLIDSGQAGLGSSSGTSLRSWVLPLLATSVLSALVTLGLALRLAPDDRSRHHSDRAAMTLGRSARVAAAELGNGASLTVDQLMIPRLAGSLATAQYSVAAQFSAPLLLGVSALASPHGPSVFEGFHSGPARGWATLRTKGALIARRSLAIAVTLTVAAPVLRLALPDQYADAIGVGVVLVWALALRPVSWLLLLGLVALRAERSRMIIEWSVFGLNVAVNLMLIPVMGAWGAAIATLVSESLLLVVTATVVKRLCHGQGVG